MPDKVIVVKGGSAPFTRDMTAEEIAERDAIRTDWASKSAERKLENIKKLRKKHLEDTDYMACSDYTMPDDVKTWRQTMRDIPQTYTTEAEYDTILAQDADGNFTHAVWSK